ncbi:MAG: tyrosine--tRNA ligase [Candidatus Thermoplasmatota archaeon]|uniref:tyrosine--tRNA ligase n=1 Tax=Ferroplasma sp. TaxID=2591003 RepID=UPI002609C1E4|nr:tyrosine--tRNA ligase [Ferroplasma sp.]MCL4311675.1 tyrosine--tRNA ligase [Candidatus Thermoplasmatota archaeon]
MESVEILKNNTSEVVTLEESKDLFSGNREAYIGFEPSGLPHIAILIYVNKINELVKLGFRVKVLLADWHARVNDKLGGDINLIRESGERLRKSMLYAGLNQGVQFIWATDLVANPDYWELLLQIAKNSSLLRIRRSLPIMGRTEEDADKDFSKYIYPLMQVTDVFYLNSDLALGGTDQRHAYMLARDIAEKMGRKKPVLIEMPLISSLKGKGRMDDFKKMSKSDPESALFLTDTDNDIRRKIKNAFCPMGIVENNPVIDIMKYLIFPYYAREIEIKRSESHGGPYTIHSFRELESKYLNSEVHPMDLKKALTEILINIILPISNKLNSD